MNSKAKACLFIMTAVSLLCCGLVFADAPTQILSVAIPVGAYQVDQTKSEPYLSVDGFGRNLVPGKPDLPSKIFALAIPPGAEVVEVTYQTGRGIELSGSYAIPPAPLPRVIGREDPGIYERELQRYQENHRSVYQSDQPYPQKAVELIRTAGYRKYNLVDVRVNPLAYHPLSGTLTYYPDITVHVAYRFGEKDRRVMVDNLVRTERNARDIILNYDQAQSWYPQARQSAKGLYDFVIITTDALTSYIDTLVNWETAKGRNVNVVTVSWINANYSGGYDTAENMRNFLRDKYPGGEWGIEDVLLIGHYDDVPMRRCAQDLGYGEPETDYYYAELSQPDADSWDDDVDHLYGEDTDPIDFYAEVNVGRIPWTTASTVQHICEKSVLYEQTDAASFKKNILLLGAFFWDDDPNPRTDNAVLMEAKADETWMSDWTKTRMYEEGYSTYPMDYNLTWTNVKNVWSAGTYAFVNYAGHGSPTSSHIYHGTGAAFVDNSTCGYLNDDYPAIIFGNACSNSDTDYLNLGQAMMEQGAVVYVGATKVALGSPGWTGPMSGSSQSFDWLFTTYVTSGTWTVGQAHQLGLRDMYTNGLWSYNRYETFEWGAMWGNPNLGMTFAASLSISLPDGPPEFMSPGVPDTITVEITEAGDGYVTGSGTMHYRYDGGTYLTQTLTHISGDLFRAILPAAGCSDDPEFYFSAQGATSGWHYRPADAPATVYTAIVGERTVIYENDFETSSDWAQAPSHTAGTGAFVRIDPNLTDYQPGDDTTPDPGIYGWITAQNSDLGTDDVDGGISATHSPVIDLSSQSTAHLSMMYFHGQRDNADDPGGDFFYIDLSNDGGSSYPVNLVSIGDVTNGAAWTPLEVDLEGVISLTNQMRIRVQASDGASTGDIIEAGIDDLEIYSFSCTETENPPEVIDDLTITLLETDLHLEWSPVMVDTNGDPVSVDHYTIYRDTVGFFPPGSDPFNTTSDTFFVDDTGATGSSAIQYFYSVTATNGSKESKFSDVVGEFDCDTINDPPVK